MAVQRRIDNHKAVNHAEVSYAKNQSGKGYHGEVYERGTVTSICGVHEHSTPEEATACMRGH